MRGVLKVGFFQSIKSTSREEEFLVDAKYEYKIIALVKRITEKINRCFN